jgi:hypothetical protein
MTIYQRTTMRNEEASTLRYAIENLINAKLCDALLHPDGSARLMGHRSSGVASADVRSAEHALEAALKRCVVNPRPVPSSKQLKPSERATGSSVHVGATN